VTEYHVDSCLASGTELVTNPTLVFCDEPTSGLDAYNAQQTINSLLTLARAGRTVICTLHQVCFTLGSKYLGGAMLITLTASIRNI
jgi:ABC-type phosphate/phosphonate transport system ATPase subunit